MKKKCNLLAALSLSSMAFAAMPSFAAGDDFGIHIPQLKSGIEVSAAALWLRPGASNLNYSIFNKALPLLQPSWSEQELNPNFSSAFELGVGYTFANSAGKDVNIDWLHLNSDTANASVTAPNSNYFVGPDYDIGPDASTITNASGAATFKADIINADFGQHINFGQHFDVRFFGGLETAFLKQNMTDVYSGTAAAQASPLIVAGPFSVSQFEMSRFSGVGPRLGMDANYDVHSGFGLLGETGIDALFGTQASNTNYLGTSQTLITQGYSVPNPQYISDQHVFQVIPGFDAKVGVDYKHDYQNGNKLTISTGYQAAVYINAISQYLPGTLVTTKGISTGSIYVQSMSHILSNYSIQGPFLKVSLHF